MEKIVMKKSDLKKYREGFYEFQYGACAERQTHSDRAAEARGREMIDEALKAYNHHKFSSEQKKVMQEVRVTDEGAIDKFKAVNIIVVNDDEMDEVVKQMYEENYGYISADCPVSPMEEHCN